MEFEVITKVLEVNRDDIIAKMDNLGAQKIYEGRVLLDYFRNEASKIGEEQKFLYLKSYEEGLGEITWNGAHEIVGVSRKRHEISFVVGDTEKAAELLTELRYERYAHQEKNRISWVYDAWRFNLEEYPEVPSYLKIKGHSDEHVREAVVQLGLGGHKITSDLDRVIIEFTYHRDWYNLRFPPNN